MPLIWVSMLAMCMEFSYSQPLGSTSNWTQRSIWNFPSDFLRVLKWASIQVPIPSQQHSLISMTHDLWGNTHPYPTSQKWRCNPMAHIMYTKFWPAQYGSQTCPFLSVINWRDAIFACKDQSMYMEFWIGQICCLRKWRPHLSSQVHRSWWKKQCSWVAILCHRHDHFCIWNIQIIPSSFKQFALAGAWVSKHPNEQSKQSVFAHLGRQSQRDEILFIGWNVSDFFFVTPHWDGWWNESFGWHATIHNGPSIHLSYCTNVSVDGWACVAIIN